MSEFTQWRDNKTSLFQARRAEALRLYYVPAAIALGLCILGIFLEWPKWICGASLVGGAIGSILGSRHARCPFCKRAVLDDDRQGIDPDSCPHCSMRLK
jgi:hypothetical protein